MRARVLGTIVWTLLAFALARPAVAAPCELGRQLQDLAEQAAAADAESGQVGGEAFSDPSSLPGRHRRLARELRRAWRKPLQAQLESAACMIELAATADEEAVGHFLLGWLHDALARGRLKGLSAPGLAHAGAGALRAQSSFPSVREDIAILMRLLPRAELVDVRKELVQAHRGESDCDVRARIADLLALSIREHPDAAARVLEYLGGVAAGEHRCAVAARYSLSRFSGFYHAEQPELTARILADQVELGLASEEEGLVELALGRLGRIGASEPRLPTLVRACLDSHDMRIRSAAIRWLEQAHRTGGPSQESYDRATATCNAVTECRWADPEEHDKAVASWRSVLNPTAPGRQGGDAAGGSQRP